ncbi:DNA helicase HerA-like ATPase [Halarchaeum rubridurum]|uniref:DNA helicase HerA-like ATPase n=1 Tax=Halarchaeum rubridurum TaxID=489911 RepID=A0A830FZ58_9EURY|nr:ATP-binding protein [Halarchaeum rubridurum]MBP1953310.1 DNA helicase HerA-like ATPase [Halarchaeum rubridurum]GGM66282.1 hypothetical protein GCM10009017_15450 [Halarchaeum rubridurum]
MSPRIDSGDDLPVPVADARPYLRVRPTDERLSTIIVTAAFERLHGLRGATPSGVLGRLRAPPRPIIEILVVSTGGPDAHIDYYLGVDDPALHESLTHTLRGLFPDTYEFETVQRTAGWLRGLGDTDAPVTGVAFEGRPERRDDWQTQLTPFGDFLDDEHGRVPLAAVVETMAASEVPMVYQALLQALPDWSREAEARRASIEAHQDTLGDQVTTALFGAPEDPAAMRSMGDQQRLDELAEKDARHAFTCTARVAIFDEASSTREELANAFGGLSHTCYTVAAATRTGRRGRALFEAVCERRITTRSWWRRLRPKPDALVVDASEAGSFCLLDGAALTVAGSRAVAPTPGEATTLPTPPAEQLARYRGSGLPLGVPLNDDGVADVDPVVLPPALQPMHVAWFGKTGSGKSTALINAMLANHAATDGADILIDPKGDGMAREYLRAHYATYGTLENVYYFDCARVLPAFAFFDIRDELAAGVPRETAVADTVDHYVEILTHVMGRERFERAVRSPDIIRYLLTATFDPVHGRDAFTHRDFDAVVRRMQDRQTPPPVSDTDLERLLAGVATTPTRSFDEIMQGVVNRIEKIPIDRRLTRVFNHAPEADDPHFDLVDVLDDDAVVIFDTGDLRSEAQRALTLVVLSNLWTALRRRTRRAPDATHPLVNVYVEEAASVAVSDLLTQLLSQSRSFGCSVTLATQFPAQLRDHDRDVYAELLNNVSTVVTGNVAVDRRLGERFATDAMDENAVSNRLRALRRGQWLVSLPASFDAPEPRPFLVASLPLPRGDPDGPTPLSPHADAACAAEIDQLEARTERVAGITLRDPTVVGAPTTQQSEPATVRVDTALAHTKRLPRTVAYEAASHALRCRRCDNRYDPSFDGLVRAIECCSSLDDTERDDIPICALTLKLTSEERVASEWTDTQLVFLQAVYNAQQGRYDPLEYDILSDSMIRLQEYTGIDDDAVHALLDTDLLRHDTDHPHRLYSVTPDGRDAIGESYRQGVDYGHGKGDLEESSEHVLGVEAARQYLEREYVAAPDSRVTTVVPYYDLEGNQRLDLAGLNDDGDIVVTVEVERINHDVARAVPEDYDKMAACDPDEAIWIVMTHSAGHDVLRALNDPPEGPVRVEKTYAASTTPIEFRIDTPGLTAIYPVEWLRDTYLDTD